MVSTYTDMIHVVRMTVSQWGIRVPARQGEEMRQALADARARLAQRSPEARVQLASHRLLSLWKRLQSASPQSVLNRGFVIVRDPQGHPVPRRAGLRAGQRVRAQFADGDQPMQTVD